MAAFPYKHHQPFLLDSAHIPFLPQQFEDMSHTSSCFLYYHTPDAIPESSGTEDKTYESNSTLGSARKALAAENQMDCSSSVAVQPHSGAGVSKPQGSLEKKRKSRDGSCLTSVHSKDAKESKSRKQKKPSAGGLKQIEGKKPEADEMKVKKACEEPPVGYIHVRARRGQATDSHSLAERVRREKISERMKLLQDLVPGCDKVTGKALMLEEIINYVQSLQNQVEFLSMKLASVSPKLYDFGVDFDGQMNQSAENLGSLSLSQLVPSVHQTSAFQPRACVDARGYPMVDTSASFLLHGQGPIAFSQDNGGFQMQVGEQRQGFLNQILHNNKCSFR